MTAPLRILGAALVLSALASAPLHAGEVVDRIVATVNRHIILQSDWDDALGFEALVAGRPVGRLNIEDRRAALDRLIDQELLREQIRSADFQHATDEEVNQRIAEIRKQHAGAETPQGWKAVLMEYGVTEGDLQERIRQQLDLMRLIDARLRPTVEIDAQSIATYYNQELLPQLHQSGGKEIPLAEVTPRIRELLIQEKMNQLLTAWMESLRKSGDIHTDIGLTVTGGQPQ